MVTKCAPAPPRPPCRAGSHLQCDLEGDIHTYSVCDCAEGVKWICCREVTEVSSCSSPPAHHPSQAEAHLITGLRL